MKFIRRLFFLFLIFLIAFFLSGGTKIFAPQTLQHMRELIPAQETAQAQGTQSEDIHEVSLWTRTRRFIFLRDAVREKVRTDHYITIKQTPESLQQAIISVEDNRFYSHHGFDPEGIMRAALVNLQYGEIEEGASTITQQLVKNLFLSHERSFGRKAEEFLLALDMEAHYSKDEILELYLNTIYFGSNYYGIGDASVGYFGKQPSRLELPEAAMLAGLPNAPSLYSPYTDFLMSKKRQFVVLDAMVRTGCISRDIAEDAKIKPIYLAH